MIKVIEPTEKVVSKDSMYNFLPFPPHPPKQIENIAI
jgi:hypothetical protein